MREDWTPGHAVQEDNSQAGAGSPEGELGSGTGWRYGTIDNQVPIVWQTKIVPWYPLVSVCHTAFAAIRSPDPTVHNEFEVTILSNSKLYAFVVGDESVATTDDAACGEVLDRVPKIFGPDPANAGMDGIQNKTVESTSSGAPFLISVTIFATSRPSVSTILE
ncbi:hypothetical protein L218DRAFT_946497 [Marasmius fiardii PR-910]|nr:hypothetical protein L218DRAFT_946497 [Marasmius fiardii PR-910]